MNSPLQISLTPAQIAELSRITNGGSTGFPAGYKYIYNEIRNNPTVDNDTKYFFNKASEINANDQNSYANTFIRSATRNGLIYSGSSQSSSQDIQNTSDGIARSTFREILSSGGIPAFSFIFQTDISTSINTGGQTIGGWAGAFRFWNTPLANGQTVGQSITSNPVEYEKFLTVSALAMREVWDKSSATDILYSVWDSLKAQVTVKEAQEIFSRFYNKAYAGNPDKVDGWTRDTSTNQWFIVNENISDMLQGTYTTSYTYADESTAKQLDTVSKIRLEKAEQNQWKTSGIDPIINNDLNGNTTLTFSQSSSDETLPIISLSSNDFLVSSSVDALIPASIYEIPTSIEPPFIEPDYINPEYPIIEPPFIDPGYINPEYPIVEPPFIEPDYINPEYPIVEPPFIEPDYINPEYPIVEPPFIEPDYINPEYPIVEPPFIDPGYINPEYPIVETPFIDPGYINPEYPIVEPPFIDPGYINPEYPIVEPPFIDPGYINPEYPIVEPPFIDPGYINPEYPVIEPPFIDPGYINPEYPIVEPPFIDPGYVNPEYPIVEPSFIDSGYSTPYVPSYTPDYSTPYVPSYTPDYSTPYVPSYTPDYSTPYVPSYIPDYSTPYVPSYTPDYSTPYVPSYTPDYSTPYVPSYTPDYSTPYVPSYTPDYSTPYVPSYTPDYSTPYSPPPFDPGFFDPIVLDLTGNGFNLLDAETSSAHFDILGGGKQYQTGWAGSGNGLLAYDVDNDSLINHRSEIAFIDYKPGAKTDLEGLTAFDTNQNGWFEKEDAKWNQFGVWEDKNVDGITDSGEYYSLDALGIQSIYLASDHQRSVMNDNIIHGVTQVGLQNGSSLLAADVSFNVSNQVLI
jgi:hypothetical protein